MMKLILKYRNKIVSLGLLPIIATLICLHFFPYHLRWMQYSPPVQWTTNR